MIREMLGDVGTYSYDGENKFDSRPKLKMAYIYLNFKSNQIITDNHLTDLHQFMEKLENYGKTDQALTCLIPQQSGQYIYHRVETEVGQ